MANISFQMADNVELVNFLDGQTGEVLTNNTERITSHLSVNNIQGKLHVTADIFQAAVSNDNTKGLN